MSDLQSIHITLTGRVQGVGFRPFVSRIALDLGVSGWVRNRSGSVEIHAEGTADALEQFKLRLITKAPPLARPDRFRIEILSPVGISGFSIRESDAHTRGTIYIPPDYFVCDDCLAEMNNPTERRYRYPFINCTQCGPRYTLIARLPYDRPNTALANFPLCDACRSEYLNPADRRYHAQPLACPECGPRLSFCSAGLSSIETPASAFARNEAALSNCIAALRAGLIVAVKGVGGYHLMCDARNEMTIQRLRERKQRPAKPLAVLVPWQGPEGLAWADRLAELDPLEREQLIAPERPIVLSRQRANTLIAPGIAPELDEIGLMLPYSPLHYLLANDFNAPLVATSANLSGEPVLTDATEVENRLSAVADAFLHHDRPILRPADDSLYRRIAGHMRPLRLGRGMAPIELNLPFQLSHPLLALGGDLKNTMALAFDDRVILSPHIGDLAAVRSGRIFEQILTDLGQLYESSSARLVCDAHPDYYSSRWAHLHDPSPIQVFHHHAHASALAGEHGAFTPMIVFTWDGTGYGEDGTLWGGETLIGQPGCWRRVGALRPFRLPGGDRVSREPWRTACALCWEAELDWVDCPRPSALLRQMWERELNSPLSSSAGRLFDGAAALSGLMVETSHEGQAAMMLEATPPTRGAIITLPLSFSHHGLWLIDWRPLLPMLMDKGLSPAEKSACFHGSLADALLRQACKLRTLHDLDTVGLSGGVFQNRRLVETAKRLLEQAGFRVWLPHRIPVNDAGISFGQIIEAGCRLSQTASG